MQNLDQNVRDALSIDMVVDIHHHGTQRPATRAASKYGATSWTANCVSGIASPRAAHAVGMPTSTPTPMSPCTSRTT